MHRSLRPYLPSSRWVRFRMLHENRDGAYMPVRLFQLFGGRGWSVSVIRTSEPRRFE